MSNPPHFGPDTKITRHPDQLAAEIDGQMVVMGLAQGKYVGFDPVASAIWRRLEQPQSLSALCDGLIQEFSGDPATIRQDVQDLLVRLEELGLILAEPAA
jgi:hypothetical protein